MEQNKKKLTAVLVGAGERADIYASLAFRQPEALQVVGLVEPNPKRMAYMKERYQVPDENCFTCVDDFVKRDRFADVVINGTMDQLHVPTSIPVLKKGYDMLLEKPFAVNEEEMNELLKTVNEEQRKVVVGHVLRYTPFYRTIKEQLLNKAIGQIISIEMHEHVGYEHFALAYVRGPWGNTEVCKTTCLLAKTCHDIDIMMWMMKDTYPVSVSSFGGDFQFVPSMKPEGAAKRCTDCQYVDTCRFSAVNTYAKVGRWGYYIWTEKGLSEEDKIKQLGTENPYGLCAWDYDRGGNTDHQSVIINFANGATGVFNLVGGAAKANRHIHIVGTTGEIIGNLDEGKFTIRKTLASGDPLWSEEVIDVNVRDKNGDVSGHYGGDDHLAEDFVDFVNGQEPSVSCTEINDSMISHLVVFKAEESRKTGQTIRI